MPPQSQPDPRPGRNDREWVYVPLTRRQKRLLEQAAARRGLTMGDLARTWMLAGGLRRLEKGPLAAG